MRRGNETKREAPSCIDYSAATAGHLAAAAAPAGYKLTEVGVIPSEWDVERIDQNTTIKTGSKNTQDRQQDGDYPFFVRSQEVERINSYSYDGEAVLTAGDGVGTGKVFHYIQGRFDVHQRVYRISEFSDRLNGRYFFYQFSAGFYNRIMSMTAKSSVDSVRLEMIAGMKIPMPLLAEQRVIAEALSNVDNLLESLDALIAKKRAIKQAVIQNLLTGKKRLPGFRGKWETKRLGDLALFFKGSFLSKSDLSLDGRNRCIHYGELFTTYGERIDEVLHGTNRKGNFLVCEIGDVLMPTSDVTPNGLATASCMLIPHTIIGGDILVIRVSADVLNGVFLAYTIKAQRNQVMQLVSGTTVFHIRAFDMATFKFLLPSVEEQNAIVTVLHELDSEITALDQRLHKARAIKEGMMQQLLTGRVRLV